MKQALKYIATFIITISILITATVLINKIPRNMLKKNILISVDELEEKEKKRTNEGVLQSIRRDEYADTILLNIIYSMDSKHPLQSFLWAKFYKAPTISTESLRISVKQNKKPNEQYLRYFHGSILILKPLLCFFSVSQIFVINFVIFCILSIILWHSLFQRSKSLAVIVLVSFLMTFMFNTPFTLEYTWSAFIMLIISICALYLEDKNYEFLPYLFIISGIMTCFFDFLTTETITCLVPLLLILIVGMQEKKINSWKEGLHLLVKLGGLWLISYLFTWFTKWLLASWILDINAMLYVKDDAIVRINGLVNENMNTQYMQAILKNIKLLGPFSLLEPYSLVLITISFIMSLTIYMMRPKRKIWFTVLLLIIGMIPLLRFLLLSNHACLHYFFTYRALVTTIISWLSILVYGLDWKEIKK